MHVTVSIMSPAVFLTTFLASVAAPLRKPSSARIAHCNCTLISSYLGLIPLLTFLRFSHPLFSSLASPLIHHPSLQHPYPLSPFCHHLFILSLYYSDIPPNSFHFFEISSRHLELPLISLLFSHITAFPSRHPFSEHNPSSSVYSYFLPSPFPSFPRFLPILSDILLPSFLLPLLRTSIHCNSPYLLQQYLHKQ